MDWEPYDYSIVYAEPYRVQQITSNWRLPFPVAFSQCSNFLLVVIFEYLFYVHLLSWVIFSTSRELFYIDSHLCVLALAKLKPDGKSAFYLWDWFCYMIRMMNGDCVYYNWTRYQTMHWKNYFCE